jgi:hypothetical protein
MLTATALIFSPRAIWSAPHPIGRECVTVYNATAANRIAHDTFRFGKSWHGDGERLHPVDWWKLHKVSVAAYYRWVARGGTQAPEGALEDWLEAEREALHASASKPRPTTGHLPLCNNA